MAASTLFAQADDAVPWESGHVTKAAIKPSDPTPDALPFVADTLFEMGKSRGYAGQITNDKARSTTVYWRGRAPSDLTAFATSLPLGVKVQVVDHVRFSQDEAKLAATRVVSSPVAAEIGIVKVSVNPDGSGIRVYVSGNDPGTRILKRLEDIAAMPGAVKVLPNQPEIVPQASRTNDAPPWKGGSRTIHGNGACTAGFAVLSGSIGYLLSANHCDPSANLSVKDGANQTIAPGGSSVDEIPDLDSLLIDPSASPATQGRVYTGGWNSSSSAAVKNWARNFTNDPVCISGGTSGQRCGRITDDATTIPGLPGAFFIEARATSGWLSAGGDSGGPFFRTVSGGVQARGILWGGSETVPCGSTNPDVVGQCTRYSYYVPISVLLNTWGVRIETS